MTRYIVNRDCHIGALQVKVGDCVTVTSQGIEFNGQIETRSNIGAALRFQFVSELPEGVEPPKREVVHQADPERGSKYKIEKVEDNHIERNFKNPADASKTARNQDSKQNLKDRKEITVSPDHVDQGTIEQVRFKKAATSVDENDPNVEVIEGIIMPKRKPFKARMEGSPEVEESPEVELASEEEESSDISVEPDWDLNVHWKKRVSLALAIKESDPDRFAAICEIEIPSVLERIQ